MDSGEASQAWDQRYRAGEFSSQEPDVFVTDAHANYLLPLLPSGSAGLDMAGGAGRHVLWLARQGWQMTLADWSGVALGIAKERAAALPPGCSVDLLRGTAGDIVGQLQQTDRRFGFITVSFFFDRTVLPLLPNLLLPGGLLLYRTYTENNVRLGNPRGPRDPEHLARSQELLETFREMKVLHYNETVAKKGVVELIAQRRD